MPTTENNMNEEEIMKNTVVADDVGKDATLEDAEEGKLAVGMRKRGITTKLSKVSMMYDVDGDGELDEAEQTMRDMDKDGLGYLSNEKVYEVMLKQMKLQQEVFSLRRLALVFVAVLFFLSLATLATSFVAATLAKDTNVVNGNLVVKDGGGVVGTSTVATTFTLTESAGEGVNGRRTQDILDSTTGEITISQEHAEYAYAQCQTEHIALKRSCDGGRIVEIPICPSSFQVVDIFDNADIYTYMLPYGDVVIDCTGPSSSCSVTFPDATPTCAHTYRVNLKSASNYAILSKTGITNVPTSAITGDIAVSPIAAASMTGFGFSQPDGTTKASSTQITGNAYAADFTGDTPGILTDAVKDMLDAYIDAAGRSTTNVANLGDANLGGVRLGGPSTPLTSGVYKFTTTLLLTGDLHFRGTENDIFIIQIGTTLTQTAGNVILDTTTGLGTPKPENIFWQVGGAVSMAKDSHMEGIILGATSVKLVTGSSLNGRILAQTAVTLGANTIVAPSAGVGGF
jgi:hypothetical protein